MRELRAWERFVFYSCFGVALEVVFTSLFDFVLILDPRLPGQSYLWMFPAWGIGLTGLEKVSSLNVWKELQWWKRAIIHAFMIFCIEALYGATLREITGTVPWDYSDAWLSIDGLIRLDYFPLWAGLGLGLERLFPFVRRVRITV